MKVLVSCSVLLTASLLFSVNVFASPNKGHLRLDEKVTVQGHRLAPGDYKLEWNGAGPNVKVSFLQGKETVATVPAHIVSEQTRNENDGYAYVKGKNGQLNLTEVFFWGKGYELSIGQKSPAGASQKSGTHRSKSSS